jgi:hypothetical protein
MTDVLPSWNDRVAKQAINAFVEETTTPGFPAQYIALGVYVTAK